MEAKKEEGAIDHVRLQLKWHHQFQFAGYYAAIEKGFYHEAGLDVELFEGEPGIDPAQVVLSGKAEFGVGTPDLLLAYAKGDPLVVLGVIFQHSPYVFLTSGSTGIGDIHGIVGKRIMIEPEAAELYAYLKREQIPLNSLKILPHSFSSDDLVNRKVDAMSAYSTDEPFRLKQLNIPYLIFSPRAGGVDFYGDGFFTTRDQIRDHAGRVAAFYKATLKGWEYALNHPEEIADLLITKYHSTKSREALLFEAQQMNDLIHPEIIPVGYMYQGRWEHIALTYQQLGMLDAIPQLDKFLYDPNPKIDLTRLYWLCGGAIAFGLIAAAILLPVWKLNQELRSEIALRKEAEELLVNARDVAEQANHAKTEFLGHVSHDLRTPLHSIITIAEIMKEDGLSEEHANRMGIVEEAGQSLLRMVNDLLDVNRMEFGRMELADEPFSINEVLDPVAALLSVAARRKGVEMSCRIEPGFSGRLRGDSERLRQIVSNLAGNAVKFTDRGRIVLAAGQTPRGWLKIEVSDTGPGIPQDKLEGIFDPFVSMSERKLRDRRGFGLGLNIVKRFSEAMGGTVSVQSETGKGSTFIVELPIIEETVKV